VSALDEAAGLRRTKMFIQANGMFGTILATRKFTGLQAQPVGSVVRVARCNFVA